MSEQIRSRLFIITHRIKYLFPLFVNKMYSFEYILTTLSDVKMISVDLK
jgi:hypothetical protein